MTQVANGNRSEGRTVSALYRAIMLEIERRRLEIGVSMDQLSEISGIADRSYPKMLYPDAKNGRQSHWETVQFVIDTLFPDGFDVAIKPRRGRLLSALSTKYKIRFASVASLANVRKAQRELMRELGAKGGKARAAKLPPDRIRAIAQEGGFARGRKQQAA